MISQGEPKERTNGRRMVGFVMVCLLSCAPGMAGAFEGALMRAPQSRLVPDKTPHPRAAPSSLSPCQSLLLKGVRFFQVWVSPLDGPRCNFSPTCSRFGYEALRDQGAFMGTVMTADRLMRCNFLTKAGSDYSRLPNGSLHDPVFPNLFRDHD